MSLIMNFIAACKAVALATCMAAAPLALPYSSNQMPTSVRDPVFGLKYHLAKAQLERLPPKLFKICDIVNENAGRQSWGFAKVDTPAGTYYVAGGYFVLSRPIRGETHKYESDDNGLLMRVDGEQCELIDPANGSFDRGSALPPEILEPLAADLRRRLERGYGGRARLRQAMQAQKIRLDSLAPAARRGFGTQ